MKTPSLNNLPLLQKLTSISPTQLRGYLVSHGWIEDGSINGIAAVWHRAESGKGEFEILQPEKREIKDFRERVWDMLLVLSEFEGRVIEDVLRDVSNYFADLIKIKIIHDDLEGGSIPLEDGVLLIEKVKELLSSVTLSTLSKKKYFSGNRPQEAADFMDKARLGQTEMGSYVVNVITPLDIQFLRANLFEQSSFSRAVTTNLSKSLDAILSTIESLKQYDDIHSFDEAVEKGVSANLCDALVGLSGEKRRRDFSIAIAFSKSEPAEPNLKTEHVFKSTTIPYLEKVSEYLKENYVLPNITILGVVKKLERDRDNDFGNVTVTAFIEDRERNITFELIGDEYLKAIHAHENKDVVECSGDIYISPRSAKLINNKYFRIKKNNNLFE